MLVTDLVGDRLAVDVEEERFPRRRSRAPFA
jgi:hypothetical protein